MADKELAAMGPLRMLTLAHFPHDVPVLTLFHLLDPINLLPHPPEDWWREPLRSKAENIKESIIVSVQLFEALCSDWTSCERRATLLRGLTKLL